MTSTLTFKKHHGNQREQCHFQGEGIRLLDLKKEILSHEVEKGKTTGSLDFDYEIKDENTGTSKWLMLFIKYIYEYSKIIHSNTYYYCFIPNSLCS